MSHVFLSYVREDAETIDQLAKELSRGGVRVWLDREQIKVGEIWPERIRSAILKATFCVVCFSPAFVNRMRSIANEELMLIIDERKRRPLQVRWLIPALLCRCEIPPIPIAPNLDLSHIHAIHLDQDWRRGIYEITNLFLDRESEEGVQPEPSLTLAEANSAIAGLAAELGVRFYKVEVAPRSMLGTESY